jgi:hypothetical protein
MYFSNIAVSVCARNGVVGVLRLLEPGLDEGPPAEIFGVQVDHTRARYRRR